MILKRVFISLHASVQQSKEKEEESDSINYWNQIKSRQTNIKYLSYTYFVYRVTQHIQFLCFKKTP